MNTTSDDEENEQVESKKGKTTNKITKNTKAITKTKTKSTNKTKSKNKNEDSDDYTPSDDQASDNDSPSDDSTENDEEDEDWNVTIKRKNPAKSRSKKSKDDNNNETSSIDKEDNDGEKLLHVPSLGCMGLCEPEAKILMFPNPNKSAKCHYRTFLTAVESSDKKHKTFVCTVPLMAEKLVDTCLKNNYIPGLTLKNEKDYRKQTTVGESRFDFSGTDEDGKDFLLEIKAVPLAYHENVIIKQIPFIDTKKYDWNDKIALFPVGEKYRKTEVISPRALKHLEQLESIKLADKKDKKRCIMCYVVQRSDCNRFEISNNCPTYKKAVEKAKKNGVEVIVLYMHWTEDGECYLKNE
jgi:DNA-binding sugar fermentation-stimulating protein